MQFTASLHKEKEEEKLAQIPAMIRQKRSSLADRSDDFVKNVINDFHCRSDYERITLTSCCAKTLIETCCEALRILVIN